MPPPLENGPKKVSADDHQAGGDQQEAVEEATCSENFYLATFKLGAGVVFLLLKLKMRVTIFSGGGSDDEVMMIGHQIRITLLFAVLFCVVVARSTGKPSISRHEGQSPDTGIVLRTGQSTVTVTSLQDGSHTADTGIILAAPESSFEEVSKTATLASKESNRTVEVNATANRETNVNLDCANSIRPFQATLLTTV
ncbi:hypothetical protein TYRP_011632 [Tyrophagus putrescentiae]|nr:hypothetical protein TYRP_011632 [Tyrophagus putrescentiae]